MSTENEKFQEETSAEQRSETGREGYDQERQHGENQGNYREGDYQGRRGGGYGQGGYGQRRQGGYGQERGGGYGQQRGYGQGSPQHRSGGYGQDRGGGYGQQRGYGQGGPQQRGGGYGQGGYGSQQRGGGYGQDRSGGYGQQRGYGQGGPQQRGGYGQGGPQQRGGYGQGGPQQRGGYGQGGPQQRGGYGQGGYQQRGGYGPQQRGTGYSRGGYAPQRGGFRQHAPGYDPNAKYSLKKRIEYKEEHLDPNEPIRLNKFLANAGVCSRREADEFIQAGVVSVNGEIVKELGTKVLRTDAVKFHDQPVSLEKKVYVLLNKPKDFVTTSDDPQQRKTVMELVKGACRERIYPVGRLDRNTTGVLLLTNDGDMASKLTHPKFLKKKIYHVFLDKNLTAHDLQHLKEGVSLDDGIMKVDAIEYADPVDKKQVGVEIHSGRNRIVRRLFESLGYKVTKLDRVQFAGLNKKNLRRGDWRYLTEEEVDRLRMGAFE